MATVPADVQGPSDSELIEAVRHGSTEAYAQLYERHVSAAYNMARQVAKSQSEADDLVSEAFAKVLGTLRSGRGPTTAFRAYLLTALRHTAYDRTRRDRKVQLADDVSEVSGADVSVPFTDTAVAGLERSLAAQAFARLPERWQTVLWHIEIEGQTPGELAPLLGLTANGVSALAYRAREGLRQAYLQVHLGQLDGSDAGVEQCRAAVDRLGAWTRKGLSKRETAQVETHLDSCERCRALAAELADVNGGLRIFIAPLVLGVGTAGYLSASSGGAAAGAAASGGAASSASTLPRQATTTAASAAVLVAILAVALASSGEQPRPVAAPPPLPPPVLAPSPPAPQPPAPPLWRPGRPLAPPRAPAPTPPAAPTLQASVPGAVVALVAGGPAEPLPMTVRNSGGSPSEPLTMTLALPPGVSAELPGSSPGPASAGHAGPSMHCDNSGSRISCTTERGLNPGESVTFGYVVRASANATGGDVTANITAGGQVSLRLPAVPVQVQAPVPPDGVDVRANVTDILPPLESRMRLDVRNTGTSTGIAEAVAHIPGGVRTIGLPPECEVRLDEREVHCWEELKPGESYGGYLLITSVPVWPEHWLGVDARSSNGVRLVTIRVTASLASARDADSVDVPRWDLWEPPAPSPPPHPTSTTPKPPTTSTQPPTTSEPPSLPLPSEVRLLPQPTGTPTLTTPPR